MDTLNNIKENKSPSNAELDLQDQENELRALGISVVDQLSLEQNVEAAVDKAMARHGRKQKLQILKKEIQDIKKEFVKVKNKETDYGNRLSGMRSRVTDPRRYMEIEKALSENVEHMKGLKERKKYLEEKLLAAEQDENELDDYDLDLEEGEIRENENEDTEREIGKPTDAEKEKMIREGKMTPFGTCIKAFDGDKDFLITPSKSTLHIPYGEGTSSKLFQLLTSKKESNYIQKQSHFSNDISTLSQSPVPESSNKKLKTLSEMSEFEKYLHDQVDKQKVYREEATVGSKKKKKCANTSYGFPRKRKRNPKEFIGEHNFRDDVDSNDSTTKYKKKFKNNLDKSAKLKSLSPVKKSPLKKKILHPKRHWKEKNLGSVTSELESDRYKRPGKVLSENVALDMSESDHGSDSDYAPTDDTNVSSCSEDLVDRASNKNENISSKPSKKKQTKKTKKKLSENSDHEGKTSPLKGRQKRHKDDGHINDYIDRIKAWKRRRLVEKQKRIMGGEYSDSDEEDDYEEFEGGYKIPFSIWKKLYKYQKTCVKWLWELHCQGCGGILGDEMGLGKTIMIISFLIGLSYSGKLYRGHSWKGLGPVLIVCPATVLHQWVKEFHQWWPAFRVAVLHDSGSFIGKRPALIHNINKHGGVLVTSYTGLKDQIKVLLQYEWHYIILDEGHKIRNPDAQITVAVKRFQTPHRLILSGSPIQNSLKELWSLFDFIFPGKLGTLPVFMQQFAVPITQGGYANASKLEVQTSYRCAVVLRDTINPYLLRRMKKDVRNHLTLPDKNEQVLFCGLTEEQRSMYRNYIEGKEVKCILTGRLQVFVGLINLRKICNHPDLYDGGPKHFVGEDISGLQPEYQYGWWKRAGKMLVLHAVLKLWAKQGHRVLLFTQSRQMICIFEKYLEDEGYSYFKMDGSTSVGSRQPLIEKFNNDPSIFIFLLTTRVGGLGVNLTGADRVIIFDPDWNPSTDMQARERAWRIGQKRHVTIYRLLTAGTIEEKIYHRQIFKQFLTNRVLKDPKQQRFFKTNDLFELFTLSEGIKEKTESSVLFAGTGSEIKIKTSKKKKDEEQHPPSSENKSFSGSLKVSLKKENNSETGNGSIMRDNNGYVTVNADKIPFGTNLFLDNNDILQKVKSSPKISLNIPEAVEKKKQCKQDFIGGLSTTVVADIDGSSSITEGANVIHTNLNPVDSLNVKSDSKIPEENFTIELDHGNDITESKVENAEILHGNDAAESAVGNAEIHSVDEDVAEEQQNAQKERMREFAKLLSKKITQNKINTGNNEIKDKINGNKENSPVEKKDEHKKKSKRSKNDKKKGKKFEGERIEYLVKRRKFKNSEDEEKEEEKKAFNKSQDDFVLQKLFKKSGVHSALSHDVIVDASDPDYLLLETEAERVAKEALKQVRLSRSRCSQLQSVSDSKRSEKKPLFGTKSNELLKDVIQKRTNRSKVKKKAKRGAEKSSKIIKEKMFNGCINEENSSDSEISEIIPEVKRTSLDIPCYSNTKENSLEQAGESSGILSSSQLLKRMQERNRLNNDMEDDQAEDSQYGDIEIDEYDPDYPSTAYVDSSYDLTIDTELKGNVELLTDIRNFVAFQSNTDGQASTEEIVSRFRDRLPRDQSHIFKALLNQICDFLRNSEGQGYWYLKGEFR